MTDLYTFIMEFRGGTYTSQVEARSIEDSLQQWTKKLKLEMSQITFLGSTTLSEIEKHILGTDPEEQPIALTGLTNTWFLSVYTNNGKAAINIIKTAQ